MGTCGANQMAALIGEGELISRQYPDSNARKRPAGLSGATRGMKGTLATLSF
jgi:hypothetical protein